MKVLKSSGISVSIGVSDIFRFSLSYARGQIHPSKFGQKSDKHSHGPISDSLYQDHLGLTQESYPTEGGV